MFAGTARRAWIPCLIVASLFAVAGCGGGSDSNGGSKPKSVTVAVASGLDTLDALQSIVTMEAYQVNDMLVVRDAAGELKPNIAAELPTMVDKSALTWRVKLRTDVNYQDGTPVTAQTVVDAINHMAKAKSSTTAGGGFGIRTFKSVKVIDKSTFDVMYSSPNTNFAIGLTYVPIQKVTADMATHPIGTGPYKFVSFTPNQSATFKAWNGYWGPRKAPTDTFEIRVIPDEGARMAALRAGEVDVVLSISPDQADQVPNLVSSAAFRDYRLVFNNESGLLADPKVRLALNLAIDKKSLIDNLFGGHAQIDQCQAQRKGEIGFDPDLKPIPFDPARARKLLQEAGATGKSIDLLAASDYIPKDSELLASLVSMWTDVGMKPKLRQKPFADFFDEVSVQPAPRPDVYLVQSFHRLLDGADLLQYTWSKALTVGSVSNPQLDGLIENALQKLDPEARDKAFQQVSKERCDQAVFGFLFFPDNLVGTRKGINFSPDPVDVNRTRLLDFKFTS